MLSSSMTNWILCAKIVFISSGVVWLAMAMQFAVPLMINFAVHELSTIWSALLLFFKPPYIYVIVNGIIIVLAASSRFTQSEPWSSSEQSRPLNSAKTPPPIEISAALEAAEPVVVYEEEKVVEVKPVLVYEEEEVVDVKKPVVVNGLEVMENEEEVVTRSTCTPLQRITSQETGMETEILWPVTEKPPVLSRFGHRKPLRPSPEGGKLSRVTRPKRAETLESVWMRITEGRHVPFTGQINKSDTFENYGLCLDVVAQDKNCFPQNSHVCKLETFKDRTNYHDLSMKSGKIRKEPSLSQDELNRRVEAFIQNFNEEMRLQRQESLENYMEMIDRGGNY